jgi:hypothetical protein
MQHPLVHWLYGDAWRLLSRLPSSVIATITSAETVYQNYKGAKTLKQARVLGFVVARNMEFYVAGFFLDAVMMFCNDDIIDRNCIQQGN